MTDGIVRLGATPWEAWVAEVGIPALEEAQWAARTLAQAVLVALAWPLRLAWLVLRQVHWGSGETLVSTFALGLPAALLLRLAPSVVWPTWEQALVGLQRAAVVLIVAWLVLYLAGVAASVGHPVFHSHGNKYRHRVVGHERKHQKVLRRVGGGGSSRKVYRQPNGQWAGVVRPRSARRFKRLSPEAQIAVALAGRYGGRDTNCDHDDALIQKILARVPAADRGRVMRDADALARG